MPWHVSGLCRIATTGFTAPFRYAEALLREPTKCSFRCRQVTGPKDSLEISFLMLPCACLLVAWERSIPSLILRVGVLYHQTTKKKRRENRLARVPLRHIGALSHWSRRVKNSTTEPTNQPEPTRQPTFFPRLDRGWPERFGKGPTQGGNSREPLTVP